MRPRPTGAGPRNRVVLSRSWWVPLRGRLWSPTVGGTTPGATTFLAGRENSRGGPYGPPLLFSLPARNVFAPGVVPPTVGDHSRPLRGTHHDRDSTTRLRGPALARRGHVRGDPQRDDHDERHPAPHGRSVHQRDHGAVAVHRLHACLL